MSHRTTAVAIVVVIDCIKQIHIDQTAGDGQRVENGRNGWYGTLWVKPANRQLKGRCTTKEQGKATAFTEGGLVDACT